MDDSRNRFVSSTSKFIGIVSILFKHHTFQANSVNVPSLNYQDVIFILISPLEKPGEKRINTTKKMNMK